MVPSAYIDGRLGPASGVDTLTVIGGGRVVRTLSAIEASNSVAGPPAALAVTRDGRWAIVIETLGQRPVGGADVGLAKLPPGRTLALVDLSTPDRPRIVQRIAGPERPDSVSISADGRLVAVAANGPSPLHLFRLEGGRMSPADALAVPAWTAGDRIIHAEFAPQGHRIAVLNRTRSQVAVFDLSEIPSGVDLRPWGAPVDVDRDPFLVRFSPDGQALFVAGTFTGGPLRLGQNSYPPGVLGSIRLAAQAGPKGEPVHIPVSKAQTGAVPEGLAVSPDGRFAVTVNLEGTTYAASDPRRTRFASLSLFAVTPGAAFLRRIGDFAFDGALPESAVFDDTSRTLAVATFGDLDDPVAGGSVDFWRIAGDPVEPDRVELVQARCSLPTPRGAHTLAIVRGAAPSRE